jgi:glycosyltransferase involved in cell wall biosynthesis
MPIAKKAKPVDMISIIIPTLNEEKVIEKTLRNLRDHLTIPHKSTDTTIAIAKRYADIVAVWDHPEKQNIPAGRNFGAARATGKYLAFIDADVYIPNPDHFFNSLIKLFHERPTLAAVAVGIRVLPEYETFWDRVIFGAVNLVFTIQNNIFKIGAAAGEFQMMPREIFERLGGYNIRLAAAEDLELFSRLAKVGPTAFVGDLTVYHTGRRAHKIGWPRLLMQWWGNWFYVAILRRKDRVMSKEWTVIR